MLGMMQAQGAGEEDMDMEQIDIRALERVSPPHQPHGARAGAAQPDPPVRDMGGRMPSSCSRTSLRMQSFRSCAFIGLVALLADFPMQQNGSLCSCCALLLPSGQAH